MSANRLLVQDVLLPRGGSERVFLALDDPSLFSQVLVGLSADPRFRASAGRRALLDADEGDVTFPAATFRRLIAAIGRLPPLPKPALVTHHHAGLQFPVEPREASLYVHTPTRFLWEPELASWESEVFSEAERDRLRSTEQRLLDAAKAVLTNSDFTAARIRRIYGRTARVVPPPVALWTVDPVPPRCAERLPRPYVLTVARLVRSKRLDALIDATSGADVNLVVVGDGRDRDRLHERAGPGARLLTNCTDAELRWLLLHAAAFVSFAVEDFGIAVAEAVCDGVVCVVPDVGGQVEIVDDRSGVVFDAANAESFRAALGRALAIAPASRPEVRRRRERFSTARFRTAVIAVMRA